jgi:hypothetical protein
MSKQQTETPMPKDPDAELEMGFIADVLDGCGRCRSRPRDSEALAGSI